jgi:O-antigen/teichoic acid export membrane protein
MAWNVAGALLNASAGFFTLPVLVRSLGAEHYGLWTMVMAISSYLAALELGLGSALGRQVAVARAEGDERRIADLVWTSTVMLCALGVVSVAVGGVVAEVLPHGLGLDAAQAADMRQALWITAAFVGITIASSAATPLLWGYERFDLLNSAENPAVILRTVAILLLVDRGSTLTELTWIVSASGVLAIALRTLFAVRLAPFLLRVKGRFLPGTIGGMLKLGMWYGILSGAGTIVPQLPVFIIGFLLGPQAVTVYAIPRQLITYSVWLCISASQVIIPRATHLHFSDHRAGQIELFLIGNLAATLLALFFAGGFSLLGQGFLHLWQPTLGHEIFYYLMIMLWGETIAMAQLTTRNIILAVGRHRSLALLSLAEGLAVILLCSAAAKLGGIFAICLVLALLAVVRGLIFLAQGLAIMGVSPARFASDVLLPCLPPLALIALGLLVFGPARLPHTWQALIVFGTLYAMLFGAAAALGLFGRRGWPRTVLAGVLRR